MAYTKYSLTPANNTAAPPDGAPEGMLPSAVNDTMRDMMAQIRDCGDGIRDGTYTMTAAKITGGTITGATINNSAIGGTTTAAGAFTTLSATGATTFSGATIANTFSSSGATITGGTINSTAIGGTTAAAGKFTTLEATGVATVSAGAVGTPAITTTGDTNTGIFFPAADTIAFTEGGTEAMRINSSSGVQVLNCLGVGNATPSTSGAGITFPATQSASSDANTLDDYEEGTWTPAYGGGVNITGTPTFSQAVYTKVGRLVTLSFKSVVNTTTGNTNTYIVATGLPFTIANVMALYSMSNNNVRVGIGQCYSSASLFIQYPAESGLPSGSDDWYSTLIYYV